MANTYMSFTRGQAELLSGLIASGITRSDMAFLIAAGLTNQEIAAALGIRPQTAGMYISQLYRYCGITGHKADKRIQLTERMHGLARTIRMQTVGR